MRHTKSERLNCRIAAEDKRLLKQAASKAGLRLSDFVVSTLVVAALEMLHEEEPIRLSPADWEAFLAVLDNPPAVSPALEQAMARFAQAEFDAGRYRG